VFLSTSAHTIFLTPDAKIADVVAKHVRGVEITSFPLDPAIIQPRVKAAVAELTVTTYG